MVVHLKTGVYVISGRNRILCNRFMKLGTTPKTTENKTAVTCGLCLRIINGYK